MTDDLAHKNHVTCVQSEVEQSVRQQKFNVWDNSGCSHPLRRFVKSFVDLSTGHLCSAQPCKLKAEKAVVATDLEDGLLG